MLRDKGTSAEGAAPSPPLPQTQQQKQPPPPIRLLNLPLIVPHTVDVNLARPPKVLRVHGGYGHGPIGHDRTSDHQGMSPGHQSPRAPLVMEEEVMEAMRKEDKPEDHQYSSTMSTCMTLQTNLPFPLPPTPAPAKPAAPLVARNTDRRAMEGAHAPPQEDRIAMLRAYCTVCGLCFTCGERRGCDNRCGPTVQLHVAEELIDMMRGEPTPTDKHVWLPALHLHGIRDAIFSLFGKPYGHLGLAQLMQKVPSQPG
ncbi:uncharacterized protein LOC123407928 [Hordeum vulgare subsp. vulgare]|uniref:uncharacterized protein LOC123407928 n=1 Tax=Hordeum vulgare subsp. vulgare TaxID=112509 RepID=UPI001D1A3512|nr:uncharacterized protein LOC123407928 [Hordeum vulgare subsp. vulgare]